MFLSDIEYIKILLQEKNIQEDFTYERGLVTTYPKPAINHFSRTFKFEKMKLVEVDNAQISDRNGTE